MPKAVLFSSIAMLALVSCSDNEPTNAAADLVAEIEPASSDAAPQSSFGFMEAMEQGPDPFGERGPTGKQLVQTAARNPDVADDESTSSAEQPAQLSMIAYSYSFGFAINQDDIPELQQAHAEICRSLGPNCRILRMSQAGTDNFDGYGELTLQVEAERARSFGNSLRKPAEEFGGEQVAFVVDGEDLSENIIDTEARLASRELLRGKLTEILRSSSGSVDELVKAEKAVAEVNEELDSTRSKLEELRNRIRFSEISISYNPTYGETQIGFSRPVVTAFRSIGSTLGMTLALIVYALTALVPITLLVLSLRWLLHRFGLRLRFWRRRDAERQTA